MVIILEMSLFCIFLDVSVDVATVVSEVKFLDYFHCFFGGVFGTFHRFFNYTFMPYGL